MIFKYLPTLNKIKKKTKTFLMIAGRRKHARSFINY